MTNEFLYRTADVALLAVHAALVLFNLAGWAWKPVRRAHLWGLGGTLFSWFGLGIAYGWGYCPLTDWHWRVKAALGERSLPSSCLKYYMDRMTGVRWDPVLIDSLAISLAGVALILSVWLNVRDRRTSRTPPPSETTA